MPAHIRTEPSPADVHTPVFDPQRAWVLHPGVAVRPEPFGALLYHFGTRRLSFIKERRLLAAVRALATEATALSACRAAGIRDAELPRYTSALATLAASHVIIERAEDEPRSPGEGQG